MSKYSIKQIFNDNWYSFLNTAPNIRSVVNEEVDKMLSCGDMSKGFAVYVCEHCGKFKVVPFRCKSRFAIPAVLNMLLIELTLCLLKWLIVFTDIVFLLFLNNSESISERIENF